jgi:hypothetical protein
VGAQIVESGRETFDADPVVRYAAEAVVGRIGDAASKLGTEVKADISTVPWREVIGMRIVVDHAYHRLDPRPPLEHARHRSPGAQTGDRTVPGALSGPAQASSSSAARSSAARRSDWGRNWA